MDEIFEIPTLTCILPLSDVSFLLSNTVIKKQDPSKDWRKAYFHALLQLCHGVS